MSKFVWDNKEIYYEVHGEGKPLLLLNGIMMSTKSWTEFIEPFSANNMLILMDLIDQGQSQNMTDYPAYDQSIQVDAAKAMVDHLGLDKVSIMGISYGGEVALQVALKYPQIVDRLVLFNTTAKTGPWLGDIGDSWIKAGADPDAYYLTTIPIIYSPKFYKDHNEWLNARRELLRPVFGNKAWIDAMERLTNSSSNYDCADKIKDITAPTLVVSCKQDYLTPVEEQQYIHSQIKNSYYVVIPECGHASMYENPVLFSSLVLGFVNNPKVEYHIV